MPKFTVGDVFYDKEKSTFFKVQNYSTDLKCYVVEKNFLENSEFLEFNKARFHVFTSVREEYLSGLIKIA